MTIYDIASVAPKLAFSNTSIEKNRKNI